MPRRNAQGQQLNNRGNVIEEPVARRPFSGFPIFGYNKHGQPVCFSKLPNRPGQRCMSRDTEENGRCFLHGGAALKGIASSVFKNGKHAIIIPKYREKILAAMDDPNYMELKNALALNLIRGMELAEAFEDGLDTKSLSKVKQRCEKLYNIVENSKTYDEIRQVGNDSNYAEIIEMVAELHMAVRAAAKQRELHRELSEVSRERAKLVETEIKRTNIEQNYVPADAVTTMFVAFMRTVTHYVKDVTVLQSIKTGLDGLAMNATYRKALGGATVDANLNVKTFAVNQDEFKPATFQRDVNELLESRMTSEELEATLRSDFEMYEDVKPKRVKIRHTHILDLKPYQVQYAFVFLKNVPQVEVPYAERWKIPKEDYSTYVPKSSWQIKKEAREAEEFDDEFEDESEVIMHPPEKLPTKVYFRK